MRSYVIGLRMVDRMMNRCHNKRCLVSRFGLCRWTIGSCNNRDFVSGGRCWHRRYVFSIMKAKNFFQTSTMFRCRIAFERCMMCNVVNRCRCLNNCMMHWLNWMHLVFSYKMV